MKRVLMVSCEGLGKGGVQAIMMGIVRNLSNDFHFDMLLFTSEARYYDNEFLSYGGKIFRIPKYEGQNRLMQRLDYYIRDFYTYFKFKRILNSTQPYDIIHCNREYENAPLLYLAYKNKIPVRISHAHIIHQKSNIVCTILDNFRSYIINKYSTERIGCSIEACQSLYSNKADYHVINNFYDDGKFLVLSKHSKNVDYLFLVQVGAISYIKNQIFTVDLLANLQKKGVPSKLAIIGFDADKEYKTKLLNRIRDLNISSSIEFYPGDADVPQLLNETNCFVMPSLHEGFGIALVEAQAMHLHCFASSKIPQSTNCGNVTFLNLDSGAEHWSNVISQWYKTSGAIKEGCDTMIYKESVVMKSYKNIYNSSLVSTK